MRPLAPLRQTGAKAATARSVADRTGAPSFDTRDRTRRPERRSRTAWAKDYVATGHHLYSSLLPRAASTFVVLHAYALACTRGNVVGIETVHQSTVQMQTHGSRSLQWNTRDVDVVGVRHKARNCTVPQENDAATHEMNTFVGFAIW